MLKLCSLCPCKIPPMAHFLWANFLSPHLPWLVLVLPFCAEHRKLWFWAWIAHWSQDTLIWGQMGWPTRCACAASSVLAYGTDFSARNLLNSSAVLATGPALLWSCTADSLKIKVCSFWQALGKILFLPKSRAHLRSSSPGPFLCLPCQPCSRGTLPVHHLCFCRCSPQSLALPRDLQNCMGSSQIKNRIISSSQDLHVPSAKSPFPCHRLLVGGLRRSLFSLPYNPSVCWKQNFSETWDVSVRAKKIAQPAWSVPC